MHVVPSGDQWTWHHEREEPQGEFATQQEDELAATEHARSIRRS